MTSSSLLVTIPAYQTYKNTTAARAAKKNANTPRLAFFTFAAAPVNFGGPAVVLAVPFEPPVPEPLLRARPRL